MHLRVLERMRPILTEFGIDERHVRYMNGEDVSLGTFYRLVYLLLQGDEIVYIGCSRNLFCRMEPHRRRYAGFFDRVAVIRASECQFSDYDMRHLERRMISHIKPPFNRMHTGRIQTRQKGVKKDARSNATAQG